MGTLKVDSIRRATSKELAIYMYLRCFSDDRIEKIS
jgi:hypothetical protein